MNSASPAPWDCDLTSEQVKRLNPSQKAARTRTSLARKVELLELYGRVGVAREHADAIPTDRAKLRRWHDPSSKLWSWSDPQVDAPGGRNAALLARFHDALEVIRVRRGERRIRMKVELDAKDLVIANLERQNAELLDQIAQLQQRVGAVPITRR
ncbi:hypothetical protein GCM10011611_03240 [Aliidongia dinghuensis]|uniref:Uncharacterized protein n=1 Tax=Aliidongia dinghuensis TaxID=1867774 RepID=A0A8J2YPM2_9PROT|nr:hypothetical protein [Aliidongia dinghuensis]GGF01013.1 hypothetical protein GCM10011611_03240 [Aliidongia dinghuensis]